MGDRLNGRTALVTGATSGIGRAIAGAFAAEGARVVLTGRDAARGAAAVAAIRAAGGTADFVPADLSSGVTAAREVVAAAGSVDVLVNNAGIFPFGPTPAVAEETYDDVFTVNVKVPFFLVAALAPAMVERGGGAVVNVLSNIVRFGASGGAVYAASKAALHAMTVAWAAEFGPRGVRVNAVAPGFIPTEGIGGPSAELDAITAKSPAGHPGEPDDVARAVLYLASDDARYVHGHVLTVDGGYSTVAGS